MLSGILVEWKNANAYGSSDDGSVTIGTLTFDSKLGFAGNCGIASDGTPICSIKAGAEIFEGVTVTAVVSSVDIGDVWNSGAAAAATRANDILDRKNVEYSLVGGNPNVKVLTQKEIWQAYKSRTDEVQAYLVLANKGYKERPWTTYEKFVKAMCKDSVNGSRFCEKELSAANTSISGIKDHVFYGNAKTSIIGVYSDISSHGCHGATVINDQGEPAFAIKIKSTWCLYIHVGFETAWAWRAAEARVFVGHCCQDEPEKFCRGGWRTVKDPIDGSEGTICVGPYYACWMYDYYTADIHWVESTGLGFGTKIDKCGCFEITTYQTVDGKVFDSLDDKSPLAVSFYQSQPLLIRGNDE